MNTTVLLNFTAPYASTAGITQAGIVKKMTHLKRGTWRIMRPKKYKRNIFIFKMPNDKPVPPAGLRIKFKGGVCKECRKPLSWRQRKEGTVYCSHKCANRANGRKARGVPRVRGFRANSRD